MENKKNKNSRFNVERLRNQEILRHCEKLIWSEIKNNQVQNTVEDTDNQWSQIIKQIITDSETVGIVNAPKQERKRWFNNIFREAVRKRNELRKNMLQTPSIKK